MWTWMPSCAGRCERCPAGSYQFSATVCAQCAPGTASPDSEDNDRSSTASLVLTLSSSLEAATAGPSTTTEVLGESSLRVNDRGYLEEQQQR